MANEAAREGWRLHHPNFVRFQQDARELLPAKSNETSRGLCPGFFWLVGAGHARDLLKVVKKEKIAGMARSYSMARSHTWPASALGLLLR